MALRGYLAALCVCLATVGVAVSRTGASDAADSAPATFRQGFELREERPARVLAADGAYEIHEIAAQDDPQAVEGARSLKVDLTLKSGSYLYLCGPMRVRPEGPLSLEARVRLDSPWPQRMRLQLGAGYDDPAADRNGRLLRGLRIDTDADGWLPLGVDLAPIAATSEIAHTQTWVLLITGRFAGERIQLSLDDIRLQGTVTADLNSLLRQWTRANRKQFVEMTARVRATANETLAAHREMRSPQLSHEPLKSYAERLRRSAEAQRQKVERSLEELPQGGTALATQRRTVLAHCEELRHLTTLIGDLEPYRAFSRAPFVLYDCSRVSDRNPVSGQFPLPGRLLTGFQISACPGEYEPVSLAMHAPERVQEATLQMGTMKRRGGGGQIDAGDWDIRLVKVWWQDGDGIGDLKSPRLVPELLLHDDAFVARDDARRRNVLADAAAPRDAAALRPVDVPADGVQQWWLTVRVPETAPAGSYEGKLTLRWAGGRLAIPLRIEVHPFTLAEPALDYACFYRGRISAEGGIGSDWKTAAHYEAEMRDLLAHGIDRPTIYTATRIDPVTGERDFRELQQVLEIRRRVGMTRGPIPYLGHAALFHEYLQASDTGDYERQRALIEQMKRTVTEITAWLMAHGYPEFAFYAKDEGNAEVLATEIPMLDAVRDAGGKTSVACYVGFTKAVADRLNVAILCRTGDPTADIKQQRAAGNRTWAYAGPQFGEEKPETYRRRYGLALWKEGYDGACNYAYQHAYGNIYDDADSSTYRDHVMAYPTVDGVVPTLQWEGWREGVDDVRYLSTLLQAIRTAGTRTPGHPRLGDARTFVERLDPSGDLDALRREMARLIIALRE